MFAKAAVPDGDLERRRTGPRVIFFEHAFGERWPAPVLVIHPCRGNGPRGVRVGVWSLEAVPVRVSLDIYILLSSTLV